MLYFVFESLDIFIETSRAEHNSFELIFNRIISFMTFLVDCTLELPSSLSLFFYYYGLLIDIFCCYILFLRVLRLLSLLIDTLYRYLLFSKYMY